MARLTIVTYVDGSTVISAKNLNDIQKAIIDLIYEDYEFLDDGDGNITMTKREAE